MLKTEEIHIKKRVNGMLWEWKNIQECLNMEGRSIKR